jgi:16S rRNA (cytosine967-C5)-methyltransferase
MTPARLAAVRVLVALDAGRTTMAAELERERPELADRRDQALFLELAAGTTRWRAALDARLGAHARRPLAELAPELRAILRLATYQLHHLDRIPEHAIVHESVEAARALGQARATTFVNAVLRNMIRARGQKSPLPPRPAAGAHVETDTEQDTERALDYLSVTLSHPRWLVARWLARVGFEACERWCLFNNASPDIAVRLIDGDSAQLMALLGEHGIEAVPSRYVPGAVLLRAGGLGRLPPDFRQRLIVQDEGSQLVGRLAGGAAHDRVLDVCASPGGKTLMLAQAVAPGGVVIAGDVRPARVALLRATLERGRIPARVLALDAAADLPFGPVFDRVLLDAPCSGLGTLRRDPDIKWKRRPEDLTRFAAAQHAMIAHAAACVRPGGALIYATCSSEPEENDEVVRMFLEQTPAFELGVLETGAALPDAVAALDAQGVLHSSPPAHALDAFFAAMLVRRPAA